MKKIIFHIVISTSLAGVCLADGYIDSKKVHHPVTTYIKPVQLDSYFRLDVGRSNPKKLGSNGDYERNTPNDATLFNVGIGKYGNNNWRTELSLSTRTNYKVNDSGTTPHGIHYTSHQKIKSSILMANAYYDLNNKSRVTPYLTAGVGLAHNRFGKFTAESPSKIDSFNKKTKNHLAWQVGLGAYFNLKENMKLDLGYKLQDMGKGKTGSGATTNKITGVSTPLPASSTKLKAHEISLGLRWDY